MPANDAKLTEAIRQNIEEGVDPLDIDSLTIAKTLQLRFEDWSGEGIQEKVREVATAQGRFCAD